LWILNAYRRNHIERFQSYWTEYFKHRGLQLVFVIIFQALNILHALWILSLSPHAIPFWGTDSCQPSLLSVLDVKKALCERHRTVFHGAR
jgi:hypothetical protein